MNDNNMFNVIHNISMDVRETQDKFIFSTLSQYAMDHFQITLEKEEFIRAIQLIRMSKEYGPGIDERWSTATQQCAYLDEAYRRGFQDGVTKEYNRIMSILDKEE